MLSYLELDSILPSYKRMIGYESLSDDVYGGLTDTDFLEWGDNALGKIHTVSQKVHKIAVLPVKEYRTMLPRGFVEVIQAAYRINPVQCCTREQISKWTEDTLNGCKIEIDLVCPSCEKTPCCCDTPVITVDVNRIYKDAHPEYYYGYLKHFYAYGNTFARETACIYTNEFMLMRRTMNDMTQMPYHIGHCVNFHVNSPIEYDLHAVGESIVMSTTFKEGEVLISYISERTGRDGYRMVPNIEECIQAVLTSIDERVAYRNWRRTSDPQLKSDWSVINQLRAQHVEQAVSKLKMPDKDKWINFLDTQWKQPLPFWTYDPQKNLHNPNNRDPGNYWSGVRKDYNFGY